MWIKKMTLATLANRPLSLRYGTNVIYNFKKCKVVNLKLNIINIVITRYAFWRQSVNCCYCYFWAAYTGSSYRSYVFGQYKSFKLAC